MKRFWWNSKLSKIFWDDGIGEVLRSDEYGLFDTDYLGSSPREIQSAEYNPETGRIKLVPKEPVTPRKVMVEVELPPKGSTDVLIYSFCQDGSYAHVTATEESDLHKAFYELDGVEQDGVVSKQQPSNPYTKEAVDAFLDATATSKNWLNDDAPSSRWYGPARDMWDAFQVLLKQREASGK